MTRPSIFKTFDGNKVSFPKHLIRGWLTTHTAAGRALGTVGALGLAGRNLDSHTAIRAAEPLISHAAPPALTAATLAHSRPSGCSWHVAFSHRQAHLRERVRFCKGQADYPVAAPQSGTSPQRVRPAKSWARHYLAGRKHITRLESDLVGERRREAEAPAGAGFSSLQL